MTKLKPFYTHNYTMLYEEYATKLDPVFTDILDNAEPNSKYNSGNILGNLIVFDLPIESHDNEFHHIRSKCYLIRAVGICVATDPNITPKKLFAGKPDFFAARISLWSDEEAIRDVIFINNDLPNCSHIKSVNNRLIKEAVTAIPHPGHQLSVDGYLDEDFPISALLHVQRLLGCNPFQK